MRTAKILNARGLISPVPMTPGRFLSDPIGMLPGGAEPCLATRARNSMLHYARSSTCACQECDRPTVALSVCSSLTLQGPEVRASELRPSVVFLVKHSRSVTLPSVPLHCELRSNSSFISRILQFLVDCS